MLRTSTITILLVSTLLLSSCGGKSGGGGSDTTTTTQNTKAVVKLTAGGTTGQLGGIDVTITLPSGVTAKALAAPPETDAGVVTASGNAAANSLVKATYTAANGPTPASVRILLGNSSTNGFAAGEFATMTLDLATDAKPTSTDFTVQSVQAGDLNGATVAGVSVSASVTLQ